MTEEEFEAATAQAVESLPPDLAAAMSNVAIVVEDEPPPGMPLLGLYEGIPLTARTSGYSGVAPDRITIYRQPILSVCRSEAEAREEIRLTVLHEIGHYFGLGDDDLP